MIPVTRIGVEISVNGFNPLYQSYFSVRDVYGVLNETRNIGVKSQSYVGVYPVKEDVIELSCMLNYLEDKAGLIKASMTVDYYDRLTIVSYRENGAVDKVTELVVDTAKPLDRGDCLHDLDLRHIEHVPSPKGVKHELCFGEYCLEVYDPCCLEEVNIYRRYDYSSMEFTWVWRKGVIPRGEYELKMRLHTK